MRTVKVLCEVCSFPCCCCGGCGDEVVVGGGLRIVGVVALTVIDGCEVAVHGRSMWCVKFVG